jgi:general secretion pathway protein B
MSFILDALKKSEAERQRQAGPTLLEMRVLPPRRRLPLWSIAVAVLLGANLLALLWFVLRRPAAEALASAPGAAPSAVARPAAAAPAAASPGPGTPAAPPVMATAPPAAAVGAAAAVAAAVAAAPEPTEATDDRNPADFAPAVPASGGTVRMQRDFQSLPSFNDVAANLPALHLDLHVYSPTVAERYALINMHKVHEGDVLPEGARVIQITRDGVVLDYRGQEFILGQQ